MKSFKEWVEDERAESEREAGRYRGKAEAFELVQRRLNPEYHCQECGYEYSTWHLKESIENHAKECQAKPHPENENK